MKVSVVVVNYNSGGMLLGCIESVFRHAPDFDVEVVVVDNASSDTSVTQLEQKYADRVTIVRSATNLGFSAANNLGVAHSHGDVLFFLNPDTEILSKAVWSEMRKVGGQHIYTTRLTGADGVEYGNLSAVPTIGNYVKRLFGRPYLSWAQGSVVIMRRPVYDALGGWPEDYFMYSEDLDLFYHAALQKIYVKALDASVMHIGGGTTSAVWSPSDRQKRVELSYLRFSRKYKLLLDYHVLHLIGFLRTLLKHPAKAWFVYSVYLKTWRSNA